MHDTAPDVRSGIWWGELDLAAGEAACWRIGPHECWLAYTGNEWRFCSRQDENAPEDRLEHGIVEIGDVPDDGVGLRRLGTRRGSGRARLTPVLADRSVVIRPVHPISLPPREEMVLFFSSPLWIKVEVSDPPVGFLEVPLQRPSDTWFGPNTREGEICYSLRTNARLQFTDQPQRPHRALTELTVANRSTESLAIDRILVPLPTMALFSAQDGALWTQDATFVHRGEGELAELKLGTEPPAHAESGRQVVRAREALPRGNLFRAFGGLIGGR